MAQQKIGIIMNGVTGRIGTNQHLIAQSSAPIRSTASWTRSATRWAPEPSVFGRINANSSPP